MQPVVQRSRAVLGDVRGTRAVQADAAGPDGDGGQGVPRQPAQDHHRAPAL